MDDTKQTQGGTLVQFPQTQGGNTVPSQVPTAPATDISSVEPTGFPKEQEPFPVKPTTEFLTPTEKPVELGADLKEVGVEETVTAPSIAEELKQVGVTAPAAHPSSATSQKQQTAKLPIDPAKAQALTKGSFLFKNPSSSLLWLAMVVLRQLKMKKDPSASDRWQVAPEQKGEKDDAH